MSWLAGWSYRKQIAIVGTADGAQALYQMKLTIHRSAGADVGSDVYVGTKCLSNYNDIRITTSGGAVLDYWIESSDAATAVIWIEYDALLVGPNTTYFYLYYGNAGAIPYSNGDNTFIFFDHFPGISVDPAKWTVTNLVTVASSVATVQFSGSESKLTSIGTHGLNTAFRSYCKVSNGAVSWQPIGYFSDANNFILVNRDGSPSTNWANACIKAGAIRNLASSVAHDTNYHILEQQRRSASLVYLYKDGTLLTTENDNTYIPIGAYNVLHKSYQNTGNILVDWSLIRNIATNEPTYGTWGAEESIYHGYRSMVGVGR